MTDFFLEPWANGAWQDSLWIVIMGFWVVAACGLVGNFLVVRRLALMGDALSHSILPGLVIAYILTRSHGTAAMIIGAVVASWMTNWTTEFIRQHSRLKPDTIIGIVFSAFFALGIILTAIYADRIDLDQECVLYGELAFVAYSEPMMLGSWPVPLAIVRMMGVTLVCLACIGIFYKELLVTSFDSSLARCLGIRTQWFHYGLMLLVSLAIVAGFEAVGAILVIAMLIFPGVTAGFVCTRLSSMLWLSVVLGLLYALGGLHIAYYFNCSVGASMVLTASLILAIVAGYHVIRKWLVAKDTAA